MRRQVLLISVLVLFVFALANRASVVAQGYESNIAYTTSNGIVCVDAYFTYNVTTPKQTELRNYTVVFMNETHIVYNRTIYVYESGHIMSHLLTYNCGRGILSFWVYPEVAFKYFVELNETAQQYNITLYVSLSDVWFNYTIDEPDMIRSTCLRYDNNYIVREYLMFWEYKSSSRSPTIYLNHSKLIELWSPNLNITQGNETAGNETYTNETTTQGGEGFWSWLFRIDPRYIVFGIIIVVLIVGYWWFSREVQKSVGTKAELKQ